MKAIAAGNAFALALRSDGTVVAWGLNNAGQTNVPAGLSDVIAISAGNAYSLALRRNGTVVAWGAVNDWGKGIIPASLSNVTQVAAGYERSIALLSNGTVTTWGRQTFCFTYPPPANLNNATAVAIGNNQNVALRSDGTVVAWCAWPGAPAPAGLSGAIAVAANPFIPNSYSLALKSDGTVVAWGPAPAVPQDLNDAVAISAGGSHVVALRRNGTVRAWGANNAGQTNVPAGLSRVIAIAAGDDYGMALVDDTPPLTTSCNAPSGQISTNYQGSVSASGGTPPYLWAIQPIAGALPPGLSLLSNGSILGVPNHAGNYAFEARVTDAQQQSASASCAIAIAGCTVTLGPNPNLGSSADLRSFSVNADAGCAWTATVTASWLRLVSEGSSLTSLSSAGAQTVAYRVDPNTTNQTRSATISVNNATLTVTQAAIGTSCEGVTATPQPGVQPPGGGDGQLHIATACNWTAVSETPWITLTSTPNGTGNGLVNYRVAAQIGGTEPRAGTIRVNQAAVRIVQNPVTCTFGLSQTTRNLPAAGGRFSLQVSPSNPYCVWSASPSVPWIRILSGADGASDNRIELQVELNSAAPRTGTISVAGIAFTVNQAQGSGCEAQFSPSSLQVASAGSSLVTVQVLTPCAYTARSDVPWIGIASGGAGASTGTLGLRVLPSTGTTARRGTVTVGTRVLLIEQATAACELSLSTSSLTATPVQGTYRVNVKAPARCGVAPVSGAQWVTPVFSNGILTLNVEANSTNATRSGTVTLNGFYTVRITQPPAAQFSCTATATPIDVRRESTTELIGLYTLVCGGLAGEALNEVRLRLNTGVLSRDALLQLEDGQPIRLSGAGTNAYRVSNSVHKELRFRVPLAAAGVNPQRRWLFRNVRVDASAVTSVTATAVVPGAAVLDAERVVANPKESFRVSIAGGRATFTELMPNAFRTRAQESGLIVGSSLGLADTGTRLMVELAGGGAFNVFYAIGYNATGARFVGYHPQGTDAPIPWDPFPASRTESVALTWEITSSNLSQLESYSVPFIVAGDLAPFPTITGSLAPNGGTGAPNFRHSRLTGTTIRLTQLMQARSTATTSPLLRAPSGNRAVAIQAFATNEGDASSVGPVEVRGVVGPQLRVTGCQTAGEGDCIIGENAFTATYARLDPGQTMQVNVTGDLDVAQGSSVALDVSAGSGSIIAEDSTERCLGGLAAIPPPTAAGSTGTFDVFACGPWSLTSDVPWIRFEPSAGTGNATVRYTIDANAEGIARSAKVVHPGGSITVTQLPATGANQTGGLRFVPVAPCRLMETRAEYNFQGQTGAFGPPTLAAGESRTLVLPSSTVCSIPAAAKAYVVNVTVIPKDGAAVDQVTVWPAGENRPAARTVSSPDGQVVANTAIVKANGSAVSLWASDPTDVIVDITGYFTDPGGDNLVFYPLTPCRVTDTRPLYRSPAGPFGPPALMGGQVRSFALPQGPYCSIPSNARAYSVTLTVVPPASLAYLTMWPAGGPRPNVSSINSFAGRTLANNVIVPAGTGGSIDVFALNNTDLLIDINGYFAPDDGRTGLYFFPQSPCSVLDTAEGARLADEETRTIPLRASNCSLPASAKAYALTTTALPDGRSMPFLTLWPTGQSRPGTSVTNAFEGQVVTNFSIITVGANGSVDVFAYRRAHIAVDVGGYFDRP
ncbi:MAG: hypothetical protein JNK87_35530 [Bryobacterales bacterium]|nr:hypothetical protein [Bryobacterales bacterium]